MTGAPGRRAPEPPRDRAKLTATRIIIWVVVAAIGIALVVSGVVGILAKG